MNEKNYYKYMTLPCAYLDFEYYYYPQQGQLRQNTRAAKATAANQDNHQGPLPDTINFQLPNKVEEMETPQ